MKSTRVQKVTGTLACLLSVAAGCEGAVGSTVAPDGGRVDGGSARPDAALSDAGTPRDDSGAADAGFDSHDAGSDAGAVDRLVVLPVLFLPTDATLTDDERAAALDRLERHMTIARDFYRELLVTDTFALAAPEIYEGRSPNAIYASPSTDPDSAHRMTAELFEWRGETRHDSRHVFVAVYARTTACGGAVRCMGGARTFNGAPGTGGGFAQLELRSLMADEVYPFHSTIVHELGHAFGLTHVDCRGYDMDHNVSIMSYDLSHHSSGFTPSATPGSFLPEEFFMLDRNELAFPSFAYDEAIHNPTGAPLRAIETCIFPPMTSAIGR